MKHISHKLDKIDLLVSKHISYEIFNAVWHSIMVNDISPNLEIIPQ